MTEEDIEEYRLKERALLEMKERGVDWVAYATPYDSRKNLSLCKNIAAWYGLSALPATEVAIEKSGALLHSEEYRECVPRPDSSAGIIIAQPQHGLMEAYLRGWNTSDTKRLATRRNEVLRYIQFGVISADQAASVLDDMT